jgi:hypothetical protein
VTDRQPIVEETLTGPVSFMAVLFVRRDASGEIEQAIAATGGEILQQGLLSTEQTQALVR